MKYFLIILISINSLCCSLHSAAQVFKGTVSGKITGADRKPLQSVLLTLHHTSDSSIVRTAAADKQGNFEMETTRQGTYFLKASMVGFDPFFSTSFELNLQQLRKQFESIVLQQTATMLKEVVVQSRKPFIEQHADRTVLNIESSILSSGASAMDILSRAPGVMIDDNDNLQLRGRQGIMVMIDGKPTQMSGQELAALLRGMPSGSIDKIELINNPGARYDAAGAAGIINIRMKKDVKQGTNGSINGNFGQGVYPKSGGGLSLNHRNQKINLFGSYNYMNQYTYAEADRLREFFDGSKQLDFRFYGYGFVKLQTEVHTYRAGADFYPGKNTTIGVLLTGFGNNRHKDGHNNNDVRNKTDQPQYSFATFTNTRENRDNIAANLNLRTKLDTLGKEFSVDADYAEISTRNFQHTNTLYKDALGSLMGNPYLLYSPNIGSLKIRAIKSDYTMPLREGQNFEAGVKASWVSSDNDLRFFDRSNGGNVLDVGKSNHFLYDEKIYAGYVNYRYEQKKISFDAGLRAEQTIGKGRQLTSGEVFDRKYAQIFPTLSFQYTFNDKNQLSYAIRRSINRPTYDALNPYVLFIDPNFYQSGNPYLLPEIGFGTTLTYTYNKNLSIALGYGRSRNEMMNVNYPFPGRDSVVLSTTLNLNIMRSYYLDVSIPLKIGNWWNGIFNASGYYWYSNANISSTVVNTGKPVMSMNTSNSITLGKGWTGELSGTYMGGYRIGYVVTRPTGQLGVGIQKSILAQKGTLRLNVSDIFFTAITRNNTRFERLNTDLYLTRDTRFVTLNFSYRFGKRTVPQARRRATGVEEEMGRTGN